MRLPQKEEQEERGDIEDRTQNKSCAVAPRRGVDITGDERTERRGRPRQGKDETHDGADRVTAKEIADERWKQGGHATIRKAEYCGGGIEQR